MARVAAHGGASEEPDGANILDLEGTLALNPGQYCSAGILAVASLALREPKDTHRIVMIFNPCIADGVHAVGASVRGGGHGRVASGTLDHHAGMSLQFLAAQIIIPMRAGEFRVRRSVAGRALEAAMAF